ncbi:MAG: UMP kinase [Elusimicrobia bacterium RIFOXYA2_FULL_50_26]|nr:MAG: UMP kinase [Elusimicrobia bacterium RIFOXYA2_FULL_50_26]OGS24407.1 MAG: UMP kinase [Elusimicrobia bacterium RIFOXYB2_FULL_50_12]
MKNKRVLLKLSGETLGNGNGTGIDVANATAIVGEIRAAIRGRQIELGIVIGAGNLWRGAGKAIDRVTADNMGMLATVMNAMALRDVLESNGLPAKLLSAFGIDSFAERYSSRKARCLLAKKNIVIFAGGTGNPFFTTDTTAALRASEINAGLILKATQVDGVYEDDPRKNPGARRFARLTFDEAIARKLKIMDMAAFSLCRDNGLPVIVFDFHKKGNLAKALSGKPVGTLITN